VAYPLQLDSPLVEIAGMDALSSMEPFDVQDKALDHESASRLKMAGRIAHAPKLRFLIWKGIERVESEEYEGKALGEDHLAEVAEH
jgi:hypothetical protein